MRSPASADEMKTMHQGKQENIKAMQRASVKGRTGHRGSIIALQAHQEMRQVAALAQKHEATAIAAQFGSPTRNPSSPKRATSPVQLLSPTKEESAAELSEQEQ
jgi:predicted nucleic acid-binding Zn ribbon protein